MDHTHTHNLLNALWAEPENLNKGRAHKGSSLRATDCTAELHLYLWCFKNTKLGRGEQSSHTDRKCLFGGEEAGVQ